MSQYKREIFCIFIPFIYGYITHEYLLLPHPLFSQIVFGIFWFWVGMRFAKIEENHIKNILVGNSLWLISLLIYVWQFVLSNDESRNIFFALFGQHYPFSFIWSGATLTILFNDVIHGTLIVIISYLIMLFVFIAGYITKQTLMK